MIDFDAPPIRSGTAPKLDLAAANLYAIDKTQPAYTWITAVFVQWLRYHFGDATRIEYPSLVGRIWNSDQNQTQITIDSLAVWKPKDSQNRPAVLVDRFDQDYDLSKRSIGGQLQGIKPGSYYNYVNGQHVVHCLGGREGEAETLGAEVWRELSRFAPEVSKRLCLTRLLPVKIGRRQQLSEEHKEIYSVPILIVYSYAESWKISPYDQSDVNAINLIFR